MYGLSEILMLILLSILIFLLYFYITKFYNLDKYFKTIPTPRTTFLLGNLLSLTPVTDVLKTLHEYTKIYGSTFHLKMGPFKHMLVTSDPRFINYVLANHTLFPKTQNAKILKPFVGNSVLVADGDAWKIRRKLINPSFSLSVLKNYVHIFDSCTDILVTKLSKSGGSRALDVHDYINRCTFDIICESVMGTKAEAQSNENSKYFHCLNEFLRINFARTISIIKRYQMGFYFTKDYSIQKESIQYLHKYADSVINNKLVNADRKNEKKTKAFLDLLLDATFENKEFSSKDLKDEVNTFLVAGHITTACASEFILYCLANNKDVQDKVYKEQETILGSVKPSKLTYDDLQEMRYLECVIKESIRLYTPISAFARETTQEVTYNGTVIPKGVIIMLFLHGLHMNPQYFPNPESFDPSRFEKASEEQHFTYIPFSAGPRICIGQKYAMLEMKTLVSKMIRNFELMPAFPLHVADLSTEIVLRSLNGLKIGLKLR